MLTNTVLFTAFKPCYSSLFLFLSLNNSGNNNISIRMTRRLKAVIFRRDAPDGGTHLYPFRKASPAVGLMSPVSILKVVVLPAPLIPSKPKHCTTQKHNIHSCADVAVAIRTHWILFNWNLRRDALKSVCFFKIASSLYLTSQPWTVIDRWCIRENAFLVTDHFINILYPCCQIWKAYICWKNSVEAEVV